MSPAYAQSERFMSVNTPFGRDTLLLRSFSGREEISRLFSYELDLLSERDDLQVSSILGKTVTIELGLDDGGKRYINGHVRRFVGAHHERGLRVYRATVVPWTWFLTCTSDCKIFQRKTVPEILEEILGESGYKYDTSGIGGDHPTWDYCVQYRETDFNFISRLMELEGIFYFFEHAESDHTMVLGDSTGAYKQCLQHKVLYSPGSRAQDVMERWEHRFDFISGRWAQQDYNFTTPSTDLQSITSTVVDVPRATDYEIYDFPGEYETKQEGDGYTRLRMEETESTHETVVAAGRCRALTTGGRFGLDAQELPADDGKQFVVSMLDHSAVDPTYMAGNEGLPEYRSTVACIPADRVYRAPRVTSKPVVNGLQTALVVGPSGEEIHTDEYGRVKLQFHWDRYGKRDENSSCWVGVSQTWAGNRWGSIHIPRIGQEVVVAFLEGDPDRPLVVGRVYNAEQMPPYPLDENKTQSGIKSRSSQGGGADNFNELRFEDKMGSEEVYFHAEKDFNRVVENDDSLEVGNNQTIEIENDRDETIKKGNDTINIEQGKQYTEAMISIEHKVGENFILIEQAGITIKGLKINIEAQTITVVKGSAMVQIEGGMITIN